MNQLEELLQQCTVKLTLPGRMGWRTGFFVAQEWILTCAHVVQESNGQSAQVQWQKRKLEAVVERSLPDPHDLALLRVTLPIDADPACVYLDEEICSRDPLYLFGYPDQDFPNGCPVTFSCEGLTGDEPALIKFALGQVRPGMSGSPLLNQRTGKVCGMVKFTRDRSFDLGGGAIPTGVILKQFPQLRNLQQQFHQLDRRWSDLVSKTKSLPNTTPSHFSETSEDSFYGIVQWLFKKTEFLEDLQPAYEDKVFNALRRAEKQQTGFSEQEVEILDVLLTYWRFLNHRRPKLGRFKDMSQEEDFLSYLDKMVRSGKSIRYSQIRLSSLIRNQSLSHLVRMLEK